MTVFLYLLISFVELDYNFMNWKKGLRVALSVAVLYVAVMVFLYKKIVENNG